MQLPISNLQKKKEYLPLYKAVEDDDLLLSMAVCACETAGKFSSDNIGIQKEVAKLLLREVQFLLTSRKQQKVYNSNQRTPLLDRLIEKGEKTERNLKELLQYNTEGE